MVFVSILNQAEVTSNSTYLDLRVIQSSGISVVPNVNINITDLNDNGEYRYKHFFNSGDGGITIKFDIIILEDDMINGEYVTDYLNYLYVNMLPVSLISDALDIPYDPSNSTYIISKISNKKQNYDTSTVWSMELVTYTPLNLFKYKNNNSAVKNALKKKKASNKKKTTKNSSTVYSKLKKCDYKKLKYSKTKKVSDCVKYLQKILYKNKCLKDKKDIDGWYGKKTVNAVLKFQKKYNDRHTFTNIAQITKGSVILYEGKWGNPKNSNVDLPAGVKVKKNKLKTKVNTKKPKMTKRLNVTGIVDKDTWIALYSGD